MYLGKNYKCAQLFLLKVLSTYEIHLLPINCHKERTKIVVDGALFDLHRGYKLF